MTNTVLVVDDEPAIRQLLNFALTSEGFTCLEAANADEARTQMAARPDLILLDWMLPGLSGVDLASSFKRDARTREAAIIMLTARGEENDKVRGLEAGADDYITKPFSTKELIARVRAALRRRGINPATRMTNAVVEIAELRVDTETHRVTHRGQPLNLSPMEFKLLYFFLSHPERVFTRAQLLDQVWGADNYIDERTVDVHIRRLRKVLDGSGLAHLIQTVRSVGYRFSEQETA